MIRDALHREDVYAGLKPNPGAPVHGWNDHSEMFRELLGPDAKLVVEIGTWLGRSAIGLANAAPNAEVICCDTWTGALEMWTNMDDPSRYGALKLRHGFPAIFHDFRQNVVNAGKQKQITPFPVPSSIGLRWLARYGAKPDLIYIDGSHDYPDVKADIRGALALKPAVVCGDDFTPGWPGVQNAVVEEVEGALHNQQGFWWRDFRK